MQNALITILIYSRFSLNTLSDFSVPPGSTSFPVGSITIRPRGNLGHYNTAKLSFKFRPANGASIKISRPLSALVVGSAADTERYVPRQIGRASCRERVS